MSANEPPSPPRKRARFDNAEAGPSNANNGWQDMDGMDAMNVHVRSTVRVVECHEENWDADPSLICEICFRSLVDPPGFKDFEETFD